MHPLAGALQNESHGLQNIERFWQASLGDYFPGDSGLVYDSVGGAEQTGPRRWILSLRSFAREPPAPGETLSHRTRWCGLAERCDALRAVLQRVQAEQDLSDRVGCLETRAAKRAGGGRRGGSEKGGAAADA